MTRFLIRWLIGDVICWQLSRDEPGPDLGLAVEVLEGESRPDLGIEEPGEIAVLRRTCLVIVMTVFLLSPLIWPLLFLEEEPGDDDML